MRVLEIEGRLDASKVESGFADVGESAAAMAREVDSASRKVEGAASRLDTVGESADDLDSKAAQATGSLGALSSGFELVGAEKYAMGLQSAALATDFLAGVGEGLNLITRLTVVQKVRDAAATAAQRAANLAAAAATRVQTAAQRALNLAMRANPIGLIITAAILLVGFLVLLYRRSERFRSIVQTVGRVGREAIGWIVDRAADLVRWVGDRIPGGFRTVQRAAALYFRLATLPMRTLIDLAGKIVEWARDKIPGAFRSMRDTASSIADRLLSPFRQLRDLIESVVSWIGRIDFPSPPGWLDKLPGVGRTIAGDDGGGGGGGGVTTITNIYGVVSERTAREVEVANTNALRRVGIVRALP